MIRSFKQRLNDPRPILLDGPTGTELTRRGIPLRIPFWSAETLISDPDVVREIHADYVQAGAEVITANTFRTHARNLKAAGYAIPADELTQTAVTLARAAASDQTWIAGSQSPLEDCYRPDHVPKTDVLEREHQRMSEALAAAGVDLILVETQNCVRELRAATKAATEAGLPVLASMVCGNDGRLLSGETLRQAAEAILPLEPMGILVNCLPAAMVPEALAELRSVCGFLPLGAYANAGAVDPKRGWIETEYSQPAVYAASAQGWVDQGARLIGGCCGTTPEHIGALRKCFDTENP